VRLHGGTFRLRSELRKGTEAIVRFPRSRVLSPALKHAPRRTGQRAVHQGGDEPGERCAAGL
jgi:hypothetical protein